METNIYNYEIRKEDVSSLTATSSLTAAAMMNDPEKDFTSVRQLRPEHIDLISYRLTDYVWRDVLEIINFRSGVIDNEMERRSGESRFKQLRGAHFMLKLDRDAFDEPATYVFEVTDTFAAEDGKTYWRYRTPEGNTVNCADLFGFEEYVSVKGTVVMKNSAPRSFFTKMESNYSLRDNNLFGIDAEGRIFCTERTDRTFAGHFDVTYAEPVSDD